MTSEEKRNVVVQFWKAYEADDRTRLSDLLASDFVAHAPGGHGSHGREEHLHGVAMFNQAFSDRHFTVEEMVTEGDTVATRTTLRGTHTGELEGHPPTGKQITTTGLTMERVQHGKIVERWFHFDIAGVLEELGVSTGPDASH
jgi:steroid delta-isomerase-like uncharacterized protein